MVRHSPKHVVAIALICVMVLAAFSGFGPATVSDPFDGIVLSPVVATVSVTGYSGASSHALTRSLADNGRAVPGDPTRLFGVALAEPRIACESWLRIGVLPLRI